MNYSSLNLNSLEKRNIKDIKDIWHLSLPDNLKSVIGYDLTENYLKKYFDIETNLGIGLFNSNEMVGFVLFGNDEGILTKLIKENFFHILKSFLKNVVLFKIKNIFKFLNVIIFILLSRNKERKIYTNSTELIIIAIKKDEQNKGYGSYILSNILNKYNKYFSKFKFICVKTLQSTPQNINFYQKNNFLIFSKIFGRTYLKLKIKRND